jgi:hypothetical protein
MTRSPCPPASVRRVTTGAAVVQGKRSEPRRATVPIHPAQVYAPSDIGTAGALRIYSCELL